MTKRLDITGVRYGRLVALEYVGKSKWLCKCDCGNTTTVSLQSLKTGNTKSCGCYQRDVTRKRSLHNLAGRRFGRLTVLEYAGEGKWRCLCDCGNESIVLAYELTSGGTKSCGCYQRERASEANYVHGKTHERLYMVWKSMKQRCLNSNYKEFHLYGGRGIKICDDWLDYETFRNWAMSNGYDPSAPRGQCTIDRIDNNGDYCPDNCRWVDMKTQRANQRVRTKGNQSRKHPVCMVDEDGSVIKRYSSIQEASAETGCPSPSISLCCQGKYRTSLGKRWRYADD